MCCGHTCSLVSVDVEAAAQAFARLFASPERRAQMGEAGQQRARAVYDWARSAKLSLRCSNPGACLVGASGSFSCLRQLSDESADAG